MLKLDDYINRVKRLPPAPRLLPELLKLLSQPDIDSSRVVSLITYDPSLTAHLLQLCNSAYLGGATPATDLQEAVTRLGFEQVYRLVAALCGVGSLSARQKGYGIREGELWQHSVTAAVAAQLIARELGDDQSLVFTAALLHDIGKIILSETLDHQYSRLVEEVERNQQSLIDAEKLLLGVQHPEVGARLLERWKFPVELIAAVKHHHDPAAGKPYQRLASFVYLGNMIAYFMGHGYGHQAFALHGRAESLEILGLSSEQLPKFMIQTFEQFTAIQALFRLARS
jgi:putative nucleotidyltransferase with HDIG domain